jgi:predicted NBD/HSP70 family sugar kinase
VRRIDLNSFQVATSETAREVNRCIVLNLIRKHEPVSRADLSRFSGLQRSTVSLIAEQLISERWIVEGAVGHLPRGRKPTFLHLNADRAGIIGVNVRPTTTTIGLATPNFRFVAQESFATDQFPERFIEQLIGRLKQLVASHPEITMEGIGISLPGRTDASSQRLVFAPNLGWSDVDLKSPIERALGLSVELENAANACALAELWCNDTAASVKNLVALTVSEGLGVGLILNNQIIRGASGLAGEFGHVTLQEDGPLCKCGNRGCWEVLASNRAAVRYYTESVSSSHSSRNGVIKPTFHQVLRLAAQGDVKAGEALDRVAKYLGEGIALLIGGLSPDVIVVVGELTEAWDRVGRIVNDTVKLRCGSRAVARITATDPSIDPRLRGTIALVLQKHFGAPLVA